MARNQKWKTILVVLTVTTSVGLGACAPATSGDGDTETTRSVSALLSATSLIATATLDQPTDLAGFADPMENGLPQNVLGGVGSGLAWAGGTTFLAVPDRGPNATAYVGGTAVDNTTSFISRFETIDLVIAPVPTGTLPFTLTPRLAATSLLYSDTPLAYGSTPGLPDGVPIQNAPGRYYFSGRSDNFTTGLSTNSTFARLDPECIRVSRDGNTVFIADEYGPFIYQFDRATGRRIRAYQLPDRFAISNLSSLGATEISGNTSGRVTNKGIEGLAITPDGTMLVALVQSPLIQDGGDGGRANRIVTIDVASGATHEYVYDNRIGSKNYNSSEIVALNDHQFLIDTRDGKGLGDGSTAVIKQLWAVDIAGAQDVSDLSGEAALLPYAVPKQLFLDIVAVLNANGIVSTQIPAKIEGLAFGQDIVRDGIAAHTLYVGNDNDFVPAVAGPNRWFVFAFTDADLAVLGLSYTAQNVVDRGPDLAVIKTSSAPTAITGSTVNYTLTVTNTGLLPAASVLMTDQLPPELTLTSCESTGTCTTGATGPAVAFDSLAGAASQTATIAAQLSCAVGNGTAVVNGASASFASADPSPGNNTASAAITAINPAPVISNLSVDTPVLWPANNRMKTVKVNYDITDNCPGTACTLSVTSTEGGDCDWQIVDAHTVSLRAERNGRGRGRTYSIAITCLDSGGASAGQVTTVAVPRNR